MTDFSEKRVWGPKPCYPNVLNAKKWNGFIAVAGPCSVESEKQIQTIACDVHWAGATFLRGGVFRAGTYPPKNDFGLSLEKAIWMKKAAEPHSLLTVIEVFDIRHIELLAPYAHCFQVGARRMQDYMLLRELAQHKGFVFLKRNMGATLDEFLGAAEYLAEGNCTPVLVERGGSTHMNHVRWDLSISLIAAAKKMTGLPIIVDASHGTGRRDLVKPMTLAGIMAGADGFLAEVHYEPRKSLTDADQAISCEEYFHLKAKADEAYALIRS